MNTPPLKHSAQSTVLIGMRHLTQGDGARFAGTIDDVRIYDRALSAEEITALKPNVASDSKPWAWWNFDDKAAKERTGRFKTVKLAGGAKVEDGKPVLDGKKATLLAKEAPSADNSFHYRPDKGNLGDTIPFYCKGQYHVFHLVWGVGKTSWEHIVSTDLVHWEERRRCPLDASKAIKFQAFVQDATIECFVNDQYAFTFGAQNYPKCSLSFKIDGGKAKVLDLTVKARQPHN